MKREPDSEVKFNPPPETKFLSVVSSLMLAVVGVVGFWGMFFLPTDQSAIHLSSQQQAASF